MTAAWRTVLVVDDDSKFRALVRTLFERSGFRVEEAADGAGALVAAEEAPPDLVLLDVRLPGTSGYEVFKQIRDRHAGVPVFFISGERVDSYDRVVGLMLGADDYLVKPFDPDELLARVRRSISQHGHTVRTAPTGQVEHPLTDLTPREREVLSLLGRGRNSKQIAGELVISPRTVSTHIQHILSKLGVHNRAQAVAVAHAEGLVTADEVEAHAASVEAA